MNRLLVALASGTLSAAATAAPTNYSVDPDHTHPSFEVDHFGGLSVWRGTFKKTAGKVVLDVAAQSGSVEIDVDTGSIDLANDKLNEHVSGPEMLDAAKFSTAIYKGTLGGFDDHHVLIDADDGQRHLVPLDVITRANLEVEF